MQELINAVQISLQNKNWYSALFIALSLPDICSKLENPTQKSQARYILWFNKYLIDKYTFEVGAEHEKFIFLTGEDFYALRCACLHEGRDDITKQKCQKVLNNFKFTTGLSHKNYLDSGTNRILQISVQLFCKEICAGTEQWLKDVAANQTVQNEMSKMLKIEDIPDYHYSPWSFIRPKNRLPGSYAKKS